MPLGRLKVRKLTTRGPYGLLSVWRILEANGNLCCNWAPGLELDDIEGALDRGGYLTKLDAKAFALGVDRWRAEKGLIAETVAAIDVERHKLDGGRPFPELDIWEPGERTLLPSAWPLAG